MRATRRPLAFLGSVALCLGLATAPATAQTEEPATDLADLLPTQIGETLMYPVPAAGAEKIADGLVAEGLLVALGPPGPRSERSCCRHGDQRRLVLVGRRCHVHGVVA